MSALTILVIVVVAVILIVLTAALLRRRAAKQEIEHRRLSAEAGAHRDQADSNVARAQDLGREAELHRRQADEHATKADEHAAAASEHAGEAAALEGKVETAGKAAARHDEQATEREQKLS